MNGYDLSRQWFDFAYSNPEKISPTHGILYFFIIDHCNRLGWKDKFGLPTEMTKDAIGIRNHRTYQKALNDLVDFGFIKMIEKSKNQYSSNIVAIVKNTKAHTKALDKAVHLHIQKHDQSTATIDKPNNLKPNNLKTEEQFSFFWDRYHSATGLIKSDKEAALKYWNKMTKSERDKAVEKIQLYSDSVSDKKYCKKARTYLADKNFNDEFLYKSVHSVSGLYANQNNTDREQLIKKLENNPQHDRNYVLSYTRRK